MKKEEMPGPRNFGWSWRPIDASARDLRISARNGAAEHRAYERLRREQ